MNDYIKLYHLEEYLFETVRQKFRNTGKLSALDFFCIIIWKANRAKSKVASRLLKNDRHGRNDLNIIVEEMNNAVYNAKEDKDRMRILINDCGFRLPMASAILTVLYPDNFTVYDSRVCNILGDCDTVQNKTAFDELWIGYKDFIVKVNSKAPSELSLRDKDKYLWGMSFINDLVKDIKNLFKKRNDRLEKHDNKSQKNLANNVNIAKKNIQIPHSSEGFIKRGDVFKGKVNDRSLSDQYGWRSRDIWFYKNELNSEKRFINTKGNNKIVLIDTDGDQYGSITRFCNAF